MAKVNVKAKELSYLELDKSIEAKLIEKEMSTVEDVWVHNRKQLKALGLTDSEIHQISVKLQLNGMDLNKKTYSKL